MVFKFHSLRDKVFNPKNILMAFKAVKKNKGKAGLDRVSIQQFEANLDANLVAIHNMLKADVYKPSPVLRTYIPKGKNDKRPLGIPTIRDRIIQQAFRQIIEPIFEKDFSDFSFGFRPGRSCHDAIKQVEAFKQKGYRYVLDADITAFYDTIPHQLIHECLRDKIADGWVLRSITNMLKAGVMEDGVCHKTSEGTPQGGVISPLLANLVGDIIDKRLEAADYKFVRYADDFIVMTKSEKELQPALEFVSDLIENELELKLSKAKTKLSCFKRGFRFLGFDFKGKYKSISDKSMHKLKDNIRHITRRSQGINLKGIIANINPVIRGHVNYFCLGDVQTAYRKLDSWMRMRLRCFKFQRKWHTDNKRLSNRRLSKFGLLSFEHVFLNRKT